MTKKTLTLQYPEWRWMVSIRVIIITRTTFSAAHHVALGVHRIQRAQTCSVHGKIPASGRRH